MLSPEAQEALTGFTQEANVTTAVHPPSYTCNEVSAANTELTSRLPGAWHCLAMEVGLEGLRCGASVRTRRLTQETNEPRSEHFHPEPEAYIFNSLSEV